MFCDFVGSTELASRLDPEDLRDVITAYQDRVAAVAARFAGFIAKYMGDGILIYFGWPKASENDAERAVHGALEIIREIAQTDSPNSDPSVRIGIATGLVVVGEEIGKGPAYEQAVIGQTPNLSARLQSLAAPGAVVIDQATRRRVGDLFDCTSLGQHTLKGFAEPVLVWRVSNKSSIRSRFEALHSGTWTPLIGREEELEFLSRRWNQAKQGSGRVVLLCGEPGIGKSRLIAELSREIQDDIHFRLRYFCSPHFQNRALHPIIGHFEDAAQFKPDDSPPERLHKLRRMLEASRISPQDVALIADLLSIQADDLPTLPFSPQRKRELTSAALNRQLQHLARVRPLLMLFEDAHWCDPTSRELLDMTIAAVRETRILLVITYRPEFQPPWIGQSNVSLLALSRLDRDQAATMASHVAVLSPDLLERIATQSDGVPLFVEELTKSMLESGTSDAPFAVERVVPATLQASLISRLDRLPMAKQIAQIGAAIGREFRYSLLAAVAAIPAATLRESLDELVAAGLVFCRGDPPDATYFFKHALVQDAAYETMLRGCRADIHARILRALLDLDHEIQETLPSLLGRHAEQAGLRQQAALFYLRAGQSSAGRSAMTEAGANLMHGLDVAAGLPDGSERQSLQAELQVALSNVQMAVLGFGAAAQGAVLAKALELCRSLEPGHPQRAALLSRTLYGEWSHKLHTGPLKIANAVAREFVELGQESPHDSGIRLMAITTLATSLFLEGDPTGSRAAFTDALAELPRHEHRTAIAGFGVDSATLFHAQFSRALACLGMAADAEVQAEAALSRARLVQHLPSIAISLSSTCTTAWILRDLQTLEERSTTLVRLSEEQGFSFWQARGKCYAGWVAAQHGRLDDALSLLAAGVSALRSSGVTLYVPAAYVMMSDAYCLQGDLTAANSALDEASRLTALTGECWCEAEIRCYQGALQRDNPAAAEALLRRALDLARRQSAKTYEVRAALHLARLWTAQGRQPEARALLRPICSWFAGKRGAQDLNEARALLVAI